MKIKDRKGFLSILSRCLPGISVGEDFLIEGADSFLFDGRRVYSYNDYIFASVPFNFEDLEKGEVISVKARKFYDFLNSLKSDEFEMIKRKESVQVVSGNSRANFNLTEQSTFSSILSLMSEEKEWKELPGNFLEGLSACIIPNNLTEMKGVFVSKDEMLSTDRKRICVWKLEKEMSEFMIPDDSAKELVKMEGLKEYAEDEGWIHFRTGFETYFSIRKMSTDFFPLDKVKNIIKDVEKTEEDLENEWGKEFLETLKRCMIFTGDVYDPVLFKIRRGFVQVKSSASFGNFSEKMEFEKPFESEVNLDLWFYPSMLISGFRNALRFYLKPKGAVTIIVFYSDEYRLIMSSLRKEEGEE